MAENPTTKQVTIDPQLQAAFAAAMAAGGGTGAISAPQGQGALAIKNDKFDLTKPLDSDPNSPTFNWPIIGGATGIPSPNAAAKPSTTQPAHIGDKDTGYYVQDATGKWTLAVPPGVPNADDEMDKALKRIDRQQEMTEKQANYAAGRGYQSNADYAKMANDAAATGLRADELKQKISEFNAKFGEDKRQFDVRQAASDKIDADKLLTGQVTRAGTEATTAQTLQGTERTKALLPGEISQQGATLAGTEATTEGTKATTANQIQATKIAGAPQTPAGLNAATSPYITQVNPITGAVTQDQINKQYQAKTPAEIAARAAQLRGLIDAKQQELSSKLGQDYSADQANKDYQAWYQQQIAPARAGLNEALDQAAFDRGVAQATSRTNAYNTANASLTGMMSAYDKMAAQHPIGPNFAANVAQMAKGQAPSDMSVYEQKLPNPIALAQAAQQRTLDYINAPGIAAAPGTSGTPGQQQPRYLQMTGQDIDNMLGAQTYAPGAPAPPMTPPGGFSGANSGDPYFNPAAWEARKAAMAAGQPGGAGAAAGAGVNTLMDGGTAWRENPAQAPGLINGMSPQSYWNNVLARQNASAAEQARQAQVPGMGGWTPPGANYTMPGPAPYTGATPRTLSEQYPGMDIASMWNQYAPIYG